MFLVICFSDSNILRLLGFFRKFPRFRSSVFCFQHASFLYFHMSCFAPAPRALQSAWRLWRFSLIVFSLLAVFFKISSFFSSQEDSTALFVRICYYLPSLLLYYYPAVSSSYIYPSLFSLGAEDGEVKNITFLDGQ